MSTRATDANLKKARIQVLDAQGSPDEEFPVLFNPTEYSLDKSVKYGEVTMPGYTSPVTQFVSGQSETLSMELFFDTYERREDVTQYTDEVDALLRVDGDLHAPPVVRFVWGSLTFKGVLTEARKSFTLFLDDGTPVRARLRVTFKEYVTPAEQRQREPRHSADRATTHRVTRGDTLWGIAATQYGDPGAWRPIARANDLPNPRSLEPGTDLSIPPLERDR